MYFNDKSKENCCGCKACGDVCPVNAIEFIEDNEGFWYPHINDAVCINCKKCENTCKFNLFPKMQQYYVYAAWNKDNESRNSSSSGGIFLPLAKHILENGGVVFGAAFADDFSVKHIFVDNINDISKLQKSKYVQSDTANIYNQVKSQLDFGKTVLFSATPCQIAGLVGFLNRDYDNLILCEVLCFGVPSPKVYKEYLAYNQKKYHSSINSIDFKDKRYGWDCYATALYFSNGKTICEYGGDSYRKFMGSGLSLRPSCFKCEYNINNSYADITLGDFYGVSKYISQKPPKNGVSCVMIRSDKARTLFKACENLLYLQQVDYNEFSANEIKREKKLDVSKRAEFFENINSNRYSECVKSIKSKSLITKLKSKITSIKKRYFYEG